MSYITDATLTLAKRIAGDIVISDHPGLVLKKWRELFHISQIVLAEHLKISPSVISDYESERRKSPGKEIIKKFVLALLEIDEINGGSVSSPLKRLLGDELSIDVFVDLFDFMEPISIDSLCKAISCEKRQLNSPISEILGYLIIDSDLLIKKFSNDLLRKIFESSISRAIIFTKVISGRSILVLLKDFSNIPNLIILHGGKQLSENIRDTPIMITTMNLNDLIHKLRSLSIKM